ncbi:hypothetical protein Tco_0126556 [Tanacetum coccineum]
MPMTSGTRPMLHDLGANDGDTNQEDLKQLFEDAEKPVYDGYDFSVLSAILELLKLKASSSWSDTSFTKLDFMHRLLPKNNELPISTYQAKNIMRPMGLEIKRIHSCPNDYMLYRDEYENLHACVTCETSRYKKEPDEIDDDVTKNGPPAKLLWYFPIIPRLKRLFENKKEAKLLRWHFDQRTKRARHAGRWYIPCVRKRSDYRSVWKRARGRTKGVSTVLRVRMALGWVKGDKERHHVVDIKAIAKNVTKTVTAAFQDKFDSQKTQMDSQKTEMEGLKAIVAHLEGRERPTCLDSNCASDKFDDLEEFRVAIGKVYPTWDATLHGSSISEGHIKMGFVKHRGEKSARSWDLLLDYSQERAEILLQSLPDSYDQVIINLTSNVLLDYLVFDDVVAAILKEENRHNNREDRQTSSRQVEALGNVASTSEDGNALCYEAAIANESRKIFADLCCNDHELKFIGIGSIMVKMHDGRNTKQDHENYKRRACTYERRKGGYKLIRAEVHGIKSFDICQNKEEVFMERKLLPGTHKRSVYVLELVHSDVRQVVFILGGVERITRKGRKTKPKRPKTGTRNGKDCERQSQIEAEKSISSQKSTEKSTGQSQSQPRQIIKVNM